MKKILFIPLDFLADPHQDFYKQLCKQFETLYYTDNASAIAFNPDYIFVHSSALEIEKLLEIKNNTNAFILQWTGDCRNELLPAVMAYKDISDITLLACGIAQKKMYEAALNQKVFYLQHAVEDKQFLPIQENISDKKIIFIGNNYHQFPGAVERTQLCSILSKEFSSQFEVYGNGFDSPEFNNKHSVAYLETSSLYNKSYIGISANSFNDKEGYYSNRLLDIMASGCCCLVRYFPKLEELFYDMENCVFYRSNEEAIEKIKYLIENTKIRNSIAYMGQHRISARHTYYSRVNEIIEILKKVNK